MMMADRNISQSDEENQSVTEHTDQQLDAPLSDPSSRASTQSDSHLNQDRNVDFSNSLLHRSRLSTRDSGYGTDLSPATVVTPSTNKPSVQQFEFHSPSQWTVQGSLNRTLSPSPDNTLSHIATTTTTTTTTCNIHAQGNTDTNQRTTTSTRLPNVVRSSTGPNEIQDGDFKLSSRSAYESFDSNQIQLGYETNKEEEINRRRHARSKSDWLLSPSPPPRLMNDCDLSQGVCSLHLQDVSFDDEDDDDEHGFTKRSSTSKNMNITNNKIVPPRCRRSSLSTRSRRYCCEDDDDDSTLGACGGCDQGINICFNTDQKYHQRSRSLNEYTSAEDIAENSLTRGITSTDTKESSSHYMDSGSPRDPQSPLYCSQGFQPGYFDSDPQDNDSDAVFYFDRDSFEDEKDNRAPPASLGTGYSVSCNGEESPPSYSASNRQRRSGVAASLPTSSGCLSTRFSHTGSVSVSTQTPHMTSAMIQQILVSSISLPNEARGSAASRLRRLSESGVPIRPHPAPLPDIIMSAGRDRSLSVPNLQALSRRQRAAREVGQELRRLSDEFNCRRNLSPVNEEFDGHPASYPTMRPRYLRHTITQFGSLLMYTFRGRHNT